MAYILDLKSKIYDSGNIEGVQDQLSYFNSELNDLMILVNKKSSIFCQESTPTPVKVNDFWYIPSMKLIKRWTGLTWSDISTAVIISETEPTPTFPGLIWVDPTN